MNIQRILVRSYINYEMLSMLCVQDGVMKKGNVLTVRPKQDYWSGLQVSDIEKEVSTMNGAFTPHLHDTKKKDDFNSLITKYFPNLEWTVGPHNKMINLYMDSMSRWFRLHL